MSRRALVLLILTAGFILNLLYAFTISPLGNHKTFILESQYSAREPQTFIHADAKEYIGLAINLKQGKGFAYPLENPEATARRMPGFPFFLSVIFRVFGTNLSLALGFQCLLLVGVFGAAYLLSIRFFSPRAAVASLIAMVLWPNLKFYGCAYLGPETLAGLFFFCFLLSLLKGEQEGSSRKWLAIGILLLGGAIYTRAELVAFLPFVCFWLVRHYDRPWRAVCLTCFILCLLLMPWSVRNFLVFKKFVPTTTQMGEVLLGSYNPEILDSNPGAWESPKMKLRQSTQGAAQEVELDQLKREYALECIRKLDTLQAARLLGWKMLRLWFPGQRFLRSEEGVVSLKGLLTDPKAAFSTPFFLSNFVATAICFPVYCLFWIGLFKSFRDFRSREFLVYVFLFVNLIAILFWGSLRYRFIFEPIMIVLGCSVMVNRESTNGDAKGVEK